MKELKQAAHQAGFAWPTVYRAKNQLGIVAKKESVRGGWIWSLPPKAIKSSQDDQSNNMITLGKDDHLRQNLNNLNSQEEKIGQNLLKERKSTEEAQDFYISSFERDDHLRQNLTNSENPKEEDVFVIDVSDLMEKNDE